MKVHRIERTATGIELKVHGNAADLLYIAGCLNAEKDVVVDEFGDQLGDGTYVFKVTGITREWALEKLRSDKQINVLVKD